ncbi:MAG TPA: alpha/beta hydrolase-fold protein [Actinomycetota bacterium]|nr:alpha/beta hydrolase-fold protein [Actinomycetota bacterium]
MTLRQVEGLPGAPWDAPLQGRLDVLTVESELLRGNALGDPHRRPLYVYLPPGFDESQSYPTIYLLHYYSGRATFLLEPQDFEPRVIDRVDALFARKEAAVPRAIVVVPDAWTRFGGAQWINSVSTGPYMDYLCDEVVPFVDSRYPTIAERDQRGVSGHSSGGYAAMVLSMLRPDVFGGLVAQGSDSLFEHCYRNDFASAARTLRDRYDGSYEMFLEAFTSVDPFDRGKDGLLLELYAMATCYSPDEANPGKALLPFDTETGAVITDVWDKWLGWDPVHMVPAHADALASMELIHIEAGSSDEYYLDLGAQAVSDAMTDAGVDHDLELFEGRHGGIRNRYPMAVERLARALQ